MRHSGEISLEDDSDGEYDDEDDSDACDEETNLESYTTPLDEEDCEVDEFMVFKTTITGMLVSCSHDLFDL